MTQVTLNLAGVHAMNTYEGVVTQLHLILISAPDAGEWSASRPGHRTPVKWAPVKLNMRLGGTPAPVTLNMRMGGTPAPVTLNMRPGGTPAPVTLNMRLGGTPSLSEHFKKTKVSCSYSVSNTISRSSRL
jgi:3,4-dihydroxy-2-butanone 4-phosphate synthase